MCEEISNSNLTRLWLRTDCSSTDPVGFTIKTNIKSLVHLFRDRFYDLYNDLVFYIIIFFQGETPNGTERIIEITKTGEPASKPVKIETTTEEK